MTKNKIRSGASDIPNDRPDHNCPDHNWTDNEKQPHSPIKLWQRFEAAWLQVTAFMVHCPEPDGQAVDRTENRYQANCYQAKARFYAYLPSVEEQRDWLEKIYSK